LEDDAFEAEAAAAFEDGREFLRGLGADAFCFALEAPITMEKEEDACCLCRPPDMR
jgi:hypothetical protein